MGATRRASFIEEFWIPRSNERADLVAVREVLEAFEIKTAPDRLGRLPRQVTAFSRLFDHCTAVIAERHHAPVTNIVPEWWGLAVIHTNGSTLSFEWVRSAQSNPAVDVETVVRLLWRDEAWSMLRALGNPPAANASRTSLWTELLRCVDEDHLRSLVRHTVASRNANAARIATRRFSQPTN